MTNPLAAFNKMGVCESKLAQTELQVHPLRLHDLITICIMIFF